MMRRREKVDLLQTLLELDLSVKNERGVYNILSKIDGIKKDYWTYMTTTPICVDFELKRLKRANYELCCALLTMLLREDHFSNGSFIRRYQAGEVERIVKRMIFLLQNENGDLEETKWIFEIEDYSHQTLYGKVRYLLGTKGKNPLIVIGANPSVAVPEYLDKTVSVVRNVVKVDDRFDSFVIANLYPQRAINPQDLHKEMDSELHKKNCEHIRKFLSSLDENEVIIWAAWGVLIHKRDYLLGCLEDIVELTSHFSCEWIQCGEFKNPHHPLYLRRGTPFQPFNVQEYIKEQKRG